MAEAALQAANAPQAALTHATQVTRASGTSFYWAMRLLPADKRDAMFAVYAFCREVDDIADEPAPLAEKHRRLAEWRAEIDRVVAGQPTSPVGQALLLPVHRFGVRREDLMAMIEGMEFDASTSLQAPDMATLEHYCDCVAGAVGMMSIRVFGEWHEAGRQLAVAQGRALQLTNILRDVVEDAARARLYLPVELLRRHGIVCRDAGSALAHPALPAVLTDLAAIADDYYTRAAEAQAACDRTLIRPAVMMMWVYRRYLDKMRRRGWEAFAEPVHVSKWERLVIALRRGFL